VSTPSRKIAVVMQRRAIDSRWQDEAWEAAGVLLDYPGSGVSVLVDTPAISQWLYAGFELALHRSEAEGYFHNVSTRSPNVFVLWRMEDRGAVPHFITVSYDEASRWMDGGAQVDPVPMPAALCALLRAFVAENYRPEPKKRLRPRSFLAPGARLPG
jgi:hypothetical protein